MGSFQKILILLMFIFLIIVLVMTWLSYSNKSSNTSWPPVVGDCPDYWLDQGGNGSACVNVQDLGTCNGALEPSKHLKMDFTVAPFNGSDATCQKYNWSRSCGLTWDGITNLSKNPCDLTTTV